MSVIARPLRLTPEEFESMEGTDGFELIDGIPREKSVGLESSYFNNEFGAVVRNFVREHKLGWVFDSESAFQCFPSRPKLIRRPDVAFVRLGRLPGNRLPRGCGKLPPDFVVEVVSPKDTWYEVEEKLSDYLGVDIPLIWVVNPDSRTIHAYRPDGTVTRHRETDEVSGAPALPGFSVRLADLLPPTNDDATDGADADADADAES